MTENAFFAAFFFSCTAAVLIFAFKYASSVAQARARLAQDSAYQELAKSMAAAQVETATSLAALSASVAQIQARLSSLETILKEVE
ncbi:MULTISPECIES: hypothetical protein [unclassified Janthinobacterium]|uniref:hypothetical protein n=1 Tax=unclassified Janthinobacterium TaxID=2610881 RepID=UPI001C55DE91|nr:MULTISPECIES: hypothetical protein [unclassified Janthinobacterium]QYG07417.1 hypothetical protein KY494_00855 [Janthinobacterium sp. PAMC25594]